MEEQGTKMNLKAFSELKINLSLKQTHISIIDTYF